LNEIKEIISRLIYKAILTTAEIQEYLNKYLVKAPVILKMVWSSSAPFYSRLTPTNFVDRIFLAGDAYHLFSPIGGQGMNTGLQDAFNLAWKLAFVLQGKANQDLLSTYHLERFKAVQRTLNKTDIYTQLISGQFDSVNAQTFLPVMSNRKNLKHVLPSEFAGFLNDYSEGDGSSSFIGRHVPYFKIHKGLDNIDSSYDLPSLKKLTIIFNESKVAEVILDYIKTFSSVSVVMDISLIEKNDFKTDVLLNQVCVIRPDGYIGYLTSIDKMEGLFYYLKNSLYINILERSHDY
jgi:hypothetical protein